MIRKVSKRGRNGLAVGVDHETLEEPLYVDPGLSFAGEPIIQFGYVFGADEQEQELKQLFMRSDLGQVIRKRNESLCLMHHDLCCVVRGS